MFKMIVIILCSMSCAPIKVVEANIQRGEIARGEVILLKFPQTKDRRDDALFCNGKKYPSFYRENSKERISLYSASYFSTERLTTCSIGGRKVVSIRVIHKEYPREYLLVDKKKLVLSSKDLKRVRGEQALLDKTYGRSSGVPYFMENFEEPIVSVVTSVYGTKRIFNNFKHSQHLGTDYRSAVGGEIIASNTGKVVLVKDLFYTGNTVIIDHGVNIFTIYGHLSKFKVREGSMIKRGDMVGLSGATGRVTGPHLHWGVKVDGHYVDGSYLVKASRGL